MSFRVSCFAAIALLACAAGLPAADNPPTIATPAAASPQPVIGRTTRLTVLGADDGGAAALTYAWSATGPAGVTFSATGTNAAKTVTATFSVPGDYLCTATVKDAAGQTVTSGVTVHVVSTLTTLAISPTTVVINPGATKAFTATAKNQFGTVLVGESFTWSVTGAGAVDAAGVFTAATTPGPATVTVGDGAKTASASIRVNAPPSVSLAAIADVTGTTASVSATGSDPDDAATTLKYTWTATGPKAISVSPNGTNAAAASTLAFHAAGAYVVTVTAKDPYGLTASASQPVNVLAAPTTVAVSPNNPASVVNPGATKTFTATVRDQFAASMPGASVAWSVDPATAGTIASSGALTGVLTGGTPTFAATVTAAVGAVSGSVPVRINAPPTVATTVATTAANPLLGTTAVFTVQGADDMDPLLLSYSWSATGPKAVTFVPKSGVNDVQTLATFGKVGSYTVTATIRDQQGLTTTSSLPFTVAPVTTAASLNPATAVVLVGAKKTFTAQLRDQFGAVISGVTPTIASATATGGTVTFSGATATFTAGTTAGVGSVSVVLAGAPVLSATAPIQITTSYTLGQPVVTPAAGTYSATFAAQASDADANVTALRYRTDGAIPTTTDPVVPAGGVPIDRSCILTVRAFGPSPWQPSAVTTVPYTLQVQPVTANVPGGTYTQAQAVTLSCAAPGAGIAYTLTPAAAGAAPITGHGASPLALTIDRSGVLTAVATVSGWSDSAAFTAAYQIILPPAITAAPTATPNPATGASTTLSVGASDPQGLALGYQWSGDPTVTFGTATAASTTAGFTAPGSYPLQVTVTNAAGLAVSGSVTVTVTAAPATLAIDPTSATVISGQTEAFTVTGADQFGQPIAVMPIWSATGSGTIDQAGQFTAGAAGGSAIVVARVGSLQAQATVIIPPAVPHLAWAPLAAIVYGTPLDPAQLTAVSDLPGTFVYEPAAGAILPAGTQPLRATFVPSDPAHVQGGTITNTIGVVPATPSVSWAAPAAISWGTALGDAQLAATASVPGTWTYTPAAGTVLEVGTQALAVVFQPDDAHNYTTAVAGTTIEVIRAVPAAQWPDPAPISQGTALTADQLQATSPVAGTWVYAPPAGTVLPLGVATLTAEFTPTDAVHYQGVTLTRQLTVAAPANVPPTVVVAAFADQSPLIGTSIGVHVLGTDDGGEANLVYQWEGAGPATVEWSVNGNHAARDTVATFTKSGTYGLVVTITDAAGAHVTSSCVVVVTVAPPPVTFQFSGLAATYDGQPHPATVTTQPPGVPCLVRYRDSADLPVHAGSYLVSVVSTDPDRPGAAMANLVIAPAAAAVALDQLTVVGDGHPHAAVVTTQPADLPVAVTYKGRSDLPVLPGSYPVAAVVTNGDYAGSAVGLFVINEPSNADSSSLVFTTNPQAAANPVHGIATQLTAVAHSLGGDDDRIVYAWTMNQGPAAVNFSENNTPAASSTTVTFHASGPYVMTCTATLDGISISRSVSVQNQAIAFTRQPWSPTPTVTTLSADVAATATTDLGDASLITYTWHRLTGPADLTFAPNGTGPAGSTTVTFIQSGTYTIGCTATMGGFTATSDPLTIVNAAIAFISPPSCDTPVATTPTAMLHARASTSVYPDADITYTWHVSGPGAPLLSINASPQARDTQITFDQLGQYSITCTASAHGLVVTSDPLIVYESPLAFSVQPSAVENPVLHDRVWLSARAGSPTLTDDVSYRWIALDGPAGVVFQPNDEPQAQQVQAVFTQNGTYTVVCEATVGGFALRSKPLELKVQALRFTGSPQADSEPILGTQAVLSADAVSGIAGGEPPIYAWSLVNGPAPITLSATDSPSANRTVATFTANGGYQIACMVRSGSFSATQVLFCTDAALRFTTSPPASQSIPIGSTVDLTAIAAIPAGATGDISYAWSGVCTATDATLAERQQSRPRVTFTSTTGTATTAAFTQPGQYVITCTATWQGFTAVANATVSVVRYIAFADPPRVTQVSDDGLTVAFAARAITLGGAGDTAVTYSWSASGPGTAAFIDSGTTTAGSTSADFSAVGAYTVTCTAAWGEYTVSQDVPVQVIAPAALQFVDQPAPAVNPVLGTTVDLHALASSRLGQDEAITYTWSASSPDVSFAETNGTNAAQNLTATFARAGYYLVQCIAENVQGVTAVAWASVSVSQQATGITVAPATAIVATGGTGSFSATVFDQFNHPIQTPVSWSVSGGGSITSAGDFTADPVAGGPFTVTARTGILQGTAAVTVQADAVAIQINSHPVIGKLAVLTAQAGTVPATAIYTWSVLGTPPAGVSFSVNRTSMSQTTTAGFTMAGDYVVGVAISNGSDPVRSGSLAIHVDQTPTLVAIIPWSSTVTTQDVRQFTASLVDQFSTSIDSPVPFTWSTDATDHGSIDPQTGLFTAGTSPGQVVVTAQWASGLSGTATCTVRTPPPVITQHITVTPDATHLDMVHLSVRAVGQGEAAQDALTYTWSVKPTRTGSGGIRFSLNGTTDAADTSAVFDGPGTLTIDVAIADAHGQTTHEVVQVGMAAKPVRMVLTPPSVVARAGATIPFTATVLSQFGAELIGYQVFWSCDAAIGTIVPTGVSGAYAYANLTMSAAPTSSGTVVARTSSGLSVQATVTPRTDTQPIITSAAVATYAPATRRIHLHVGAADPGGSGALTYIWTLGANPHASVSFSDNRTSTASDTDATIYRAGTYAFTVDAVNGGRQIASSTVRITVDQTLTVLAITPTSAVGLTGATLTYTATQSDQFGDPLQSAQAIVWQLADDGVIGSLASAGTTCTIQGLEPGTSTVTATAGTLSAQATVTVEEPWTLPAPQYLQAMNIGSTGVRLDWGNAIVFSSDTSLAGYDILRNGMRIGTWTMAEASFNAAHSVLRGSQADGSYIDLGLPSGSYDYAVVARDALGNVSNPSSDAWISVDGAISPSLVYDVFATDDLGGNGLHLDWSSYPAQLPDGGTSISGYSVYRIGAPLLDISNPENYTWVGMAWGTDFDDYGATVNAVYAYLVVPSNDTGVDDLATLLQDAEFYQSPAACVAFYKVITPPPPTPPSDPPTYGGSPVATLPPPAHLHVIDEDGYTVTLGWDLPSPAPTDAYDYYLFTEGGYDFVNKVSKTTNTMVVGKPLFGNTLHLAVVAARPFAADPTLWSGLWSIARDQTTAMSFIYRFSFIPSAVTLAVYSTGTETTVPMPTIVAVRDQMEVPVLTVTFPYSTGTFDMLQGFEAELDGTTVVRTWPRDIACPYGDMIVSPSSYTGSWLLRGLSLPSTHTLRLRGIGVGGVHSAWTPWATVRAQDATPPTVPQGLTAAVDAAGQVLLTWQAASDAVGVAGYDVERNGKALRQVTGTQATDVISGAMPVTYAVRAYDTQGNHSDWSAEVAVRLITTASTVPAPDQLRLLAQDATGIRIGWRPPGLAIDHYVVWRGPDIATLATVGSTASPEWSDSGLVPDRAYIYAVQAVTASGMTSSRSQPLAVLSGTGPSIQAPAAVVDAGGALQAGSAQVAASEADVRVGAVDDGGAAALTFTWTQADGSPQVPISITPNASAAAAQAHLTFTVSGTYALRVTVADAAGRTAVSDLTVTVLPVPTTGRILPPVATLHPGGVQAFQFRVEDQFGASMPAGDVTWTADDDAIDAVGTFTAPTVGQGPWQIQASAGALTDSAAVTGDPGDNDPPHVSVTATRTPGTTTAVLVAIATDDGGTDNLTYAWTLVDGPAGASSTISAADTATAGMVLTVPGTYHVRCDVSDALGATGSDIATLVYRSGPTAHRPVFVTAPTAVLSDGVNLHLSGLAVVPDSPADGITYQWSIAGPVGVTGPPRSTAWGASDQDVAIAAAGTYVLTLTAQSPTGEQVVGQTSCSVAPVLSGLAITPPAAMVSSGGTIGLVATGVDQFGANIGTLDAVEWSVDGDGEVIDGVVTAGSVGAEHVTAQAGDLEATAQLTVVGPVDLYLDDATLAQGGTEQTNAGQRFYTMSTGIVVHARRPEGMTDAIAINDQGVHLADIPAGTSDAVLQLAQGEHVLVGYVGAGVDASDAGLTPLHIVVVAEPTSQVTFLPDAASADQDLVAKTGHLTLNANDDGGATGNAWLRSCGMPIFSYAAMQGARMAQLSLSPGVLVRSVQVVWSSSSAANPDVSVRGDLQASPDGDAVLCDATLPDIQSTSYSQTFVYTLKNGVIGYVAGPTVVVARQKPDLRLTGGRAAYVNGLVRIGTPVDPMAALDMTYVAMSYPPNIAGGQRQPAPIIALWQDDGRSMVGSARRRSPAGGAAKYGRWYLASPLAIGQVSSLVGMDVNGNLSAPVRIMPVSSVMYGQDFMTINRQSANDFPDYLTMGEWWVEMGNDAFWLINLGRPNNWQAYGRNGGVNDGVVGPGEFKATFYNVERYYADSSRSVSLIGSTDYDMQGITNGYLGTGQCLIPYGSMPMTVSQSGWYGQRDSFGKLLTQDALVHYTYKLQGFGWANYYVKPGSDSAWADPCKIQPVPIPPRQGVRLAGPGEVIDPNFAIQVPVLDQNPAGVASPLIITIPPSWDNTPHTHDVRILDDGMRQSQDFARAVGAKIASHAQVFTPSDVGILAQPDSTDAYEMSTLFHIPVGPGGLTEGGTLDLHYGTTLTSTNPGQLPPAWDNPGDRWMRSIRIDGDVIMAGQSATVRITSGFVDAAHPLSSFDAHTMDPVHFLIGGQDVTLSYSASQAAISSSDGLPSDKIAITAQTLTANPSRPDAQQTLELTLQVGADVPGGLADVDVLLGAIVSHRMPGAVAVCKVQVNPIELWQMEDKQYAIQIAGRESWANPPPVDGDVWISVVLPHLSDSDARNVVRSWSIGWNGMEPHCFYLKPGSGAFQRQTTSYLIDVDDGMARFLGGLAGETSADQLHDSGVSIYDYTIGGDSLARWGFDEGIDGQVIIKHRKLKETLQTDYGMMRAPYGATTLYGNWATISFDLSSGEPEPVIRPSNGDMVGANDRFMVLYDFNLGVSSVDAPVDDAGASQAAPIVSWLGDSTFAVSGEKVGDTIVQIYPIFVDDGTGLSEPELTDPILEIPVQVDMPELSEPGLLQLGTARDNLAARQNYSGSGVLLQKKTPVPPSKGVIDPDWQLPVSYRAQYGVIDQGNTENTRELDAMFEFCMYMIAQIVPASVETPTMHWLDPVSGANSIYKIPPTQANLTAPSIELARDQYWQIWNMAGLAVGSQPMLNSLGTESQAAEAWRARIVKSGPPLQAWQRFAKHFTRDAQIDRTDPDAIRQRQVLEVKLKSYMDQAAIARLKRYFSVAGNYRLNALPVNRFGVDGSIASIGPDVLVDTSPTFWNSIVDSFLKTSPLTRLFDTKITPNWHVGHPFTEDVIHWMIAERLSWVDKLLKGITAAPGSDQFPIRTDPMAMSPANNVPLTYAIDPASNRIYFLIPDRFLTTDQFGHTIFIGSNSSNIHIGFDGTSTVNRIDGQSPDGFRLGVFEGPAPHDRIDIVGTDDSGLAVVRLMQEVHVLEHLLNSRAVDAFWTDFRNQVGQANFLLFCVADFVAQPTDIYKAIWGQDLATGQTIGAEERLLAGMMIGVNVIMGGVPGSELVQRGALFIRDTIAKDALESARQMMSGLTADARSAVEDMAQGGGVIGSDVAKAGFGTMKNVSGAIVEGAARYTSFLSLPIEQLFKSHAGLGRLSEQVLVHAGSQAPHLNTLVGLEESAVRRIPSAQAVRAAPTHAGAAAAIAANEDLSMAQRVVNMAKAQNMAAKDCGELLNGVPQCFPAGTRVLMDDGSWKPIESIGRGDRVMSRDQWHSESPREARTVIATSVRAADTLVELDMVASDGTGTSIRCTPDHPYWVAGQGWMSAKDIPLGAALSGGDEVRVVARTIIMGSVMVYNLEVETDRTYFVSSISLRGPPTVLWVHNENCAIRSRIEQLVVSNARDLGYQITENQKILAIDAILKRAANNGGRGLFVKVTKASGTGTQDAIINRLINRIELTDGPRAITWVSERPSSSKFVLAYERGAEGSLFDAISGESIVPALPFKNPRPGRAISDFKKFDGVLRNPDGSLTKVLIDRKLVSLATVRKNGFRENLKRTITCLLDDTNRQAGYTCIIEVPTDAVKEAIEDLVENFGGHDVITVRKFAP